MKMAGPDIILFVIGAVLFAGAGYGLIATGGNLGGSTSALGVFEVTYTTETNEIGSEDVANLGGTQEVTFDAAAPEALDANRAIVTVSCTDQAGAVAPFQVVVEVVGPNGTTGEGDGQCGTPIEVVMDGIVPKPVDTTVPGRTEEEAHANHEGHHNATAVGEWTVTLSGSRGQAGGAIPVANPGGTVTFAIEQWVPVYTGVNV